MTVNVIAEIGVNFSSISEALYMIDCAKDAGAAAVKFQLFNKENIKDSPLYSELEKRILTEQNLEALHRRAERLEIGFILTPMYLDAVPLAAKYATMLKIRHKDNENVELIKKAWETNLDLLISISSRPLNAFDPHIKYLYCIPKYPAEPEDFNYNTACTCDGVSLHYPHNLFDMVFAIDRNRDEVYIEKHVVDDHWYATQSGKKPLDLAVSVTFSSLKTFINELKLLERMHRVRFRI